MSGTYEDACKCNEPPEPLVKLYDWVNVEKSQKNQAGTWIISDQQPKKADPSPNNKGPNGSPGPTGSPAEPAPKSSPGRAQCGCGKQGSNGENKLYI